VGPLLGGLVADQFGLSAPFHFYATGLIFATVIAYVVMGARPAVAAAGDGAPIAKKSPMESLRTARPLFKDQRFTVALFATFVGWWTISGPAQTVGALFADEKLGFSPRQIGLAVTLLAVGEVIVLFFAGPASDKRGRKFVLVPSLLVAAVGTLLLGQIEPFPLLYYPLAIAIGASIAAGGTAAGGLLADSLPKGGSGAAVGVNQMAGDLGYLIAPVATLSLAQATSFRLAYVLGAIPAAIAFFVALRLPSGPPAKHLPEEEPVPEPATPVG